MTGKEISALGLRRMLLLRPTMLDVEVNEGSGEEDIEVTGVLRTALRRLEDRALLDLRSNAALRGMLGRVWGSWVCEDSSRAGLEWSLIMEEEEAEVLDLKLEKKRR